MAKHLISIYLFLSSLRGTFQRLKHKGLTLVETMIAVAILAVMTTGCLLILQHGTDAYLHSKGEQASLERAKQHIPVILNNIRGASSFRLPSQAGANSITYKYNYAIVGGRGGTSVIEDRCITLEYDSNAKTVNRYQRTIDSSDSDRDCNPLNSTIESTDILIYNADGIRFYPDNDFSQLVILEYVLQEGLPSQVTYRYKLAVTPKLPTSEEE